MRVRGHIERDQVAPVSRGVVVLSSRLEVVGTVDGRLEVSGISAPASGTPPADIFWAHLHAV